MRTTGTSGDFAFTRRRTSRPPNRGILRSTITTSGADAANTSMASSPFWAVTTSKPSALNTSAAVMRTLASSSASSALRRSRMAMGNSHYSHRPGMAQNLSPYAIMAIMTAPRWGVTIPLTGISLAEHERVYREAEELGYTDFWSAESDVDGVVPLALAAAWTKRATLGTAILGVFNRGPALLAMTAAALGEAAPGRFCLGVGSGSSVNAGRWNGASFERPLTRVGDMVRAVRMALDGQQMNYDGEMLKVSGYRVGRPAPERVPI